MFVFFTESSGVVTLSWFKAHSGFYFLYFFGGCQGGVLFTYDQQSQSFCKNELSSAHLHLPSLSKKQVACRHIVWLEMEYKLYKMHFAIWQQGLFKNDLLNESRELAQLS